MYLPHAVKMDPLVYVAAASVILILIVLLTFLRKTVKEDAAEPQQEGGDVIAAGRVVRRREAPGGAARRRAGRNRMAAAQLDDSDEEAPDIVLPEGKVGAKKMRKLEEKAERKRQREAELQEREDKKRREAKLEEQRKREEAKREAEEAEKAETDRLAREEQEKREHEEYLKLKEAFTVEEEGEEVIVDTSSESLLQEFIDYIKSMKVVMLEDLAANFKIKTQDAINRVNDLIEEGRLTGVMDDRGKFIYITQEELEAVAKFIKQRGRVSITELAESSNLLINLNPDNKDVMHKQLLGDTDATVTA